MPPLDGGIRLPNAPLSDIASMQQQQQQSGSPQLPNSPRKAATLPSPFYSNGNGNGYPGQNGGNGNGRAPLPERRHTSSEIDVPAAGSWQPMPELKEGGAGGARGRSDSTPALVQPAAVAAT